MIKLRRLFLKNFLVSVSLIILGSFGFITKTKGQNKTLINKKKFNNFIWYLNRNDK